MPEDISRLAEKYMKEMRRAAADAQVGIEKAAQEVDRLGKMVYKDLKEGLKDSESSVEGVRQRMADDLNREIPMILEDMHRLRDKMERYVKDVQEQLRKK